MTAGSGKIALRIPAILSGNMRLSAANLAGLDRYEDWPDPVNFFLFGGSGRSQVDSTNRFSHFGIEENIRQSSENPSISEPGGTDPDPSQDSNAPDRSKARGLRTSA